MGWLAHARISRQGGLDVHGRDQRGTDGDAHYADPLRPAEALAKEEYGPDHRDGGELRGEDGRHRDVGFGAETDANEANDLSQPCEHHQWRSETR